MPEFAFDLAPRGLALDRLAFVVELLALGEAEFNLGAPAAEVNLQRHHRVALFAGMAPPAVDLAPMHQQLARADFLVTELSGRRVGADMHAVQERLTVFDPRVAVTQVDLVRAQRFDFGAGQCESALKRLLDTEILPSFAIV